MSSILIKNIKEIVTMDNAKNRLKNFSLLIKDNIIDKITRDIKDEVEETIDGTNYFLFPGLINTHHHFYQTLTRNIPPGTKCRIICLVKISLPYLGSLNPRSCLL